MNPQVAHFYEFGPFRLDASRRLLLRNDEPVPLTPKALETLLVLVRNSGNVVEKSELMNAIWPDAFVEEGTLVQNIFTLRKVLGESPEGERYIGTVPRRGYCFLAPVAERYDDSSVVIEEFSRSAITIEYEDKSPARQSPEPRMQSETGERRWLGFRSRPVLASLALLAVIAAISIRVLVTATGDSLSDIRSLAVLPFKSIGD